MLTKDREAILHSLTRDASNRLTICEQLRLIYDVVYTLDEEKKEQITEMLIEAFNMGKKMNSRLAHYKREYLNESGHTGDNLIRLTDTTQRKRMRRNRE